MLFDCIRIKFIELLSKYRLYVVKHRFLNNEYMYPLGSIASDLSQTNRNGKFVSGSSQSPLEVSLFLLNAHTFEYILENQTMINYVKLSFSRVRLSPNVYISICLQSSVFVLTHLDLALSPITHPVQSFGWP